MTTNDELTEWGPFWVALPFWLGLHSQAGLVEPAKAGA